MELNRAIQALISGLREEHEQRTGHDATFKRNPDGTPANKDCPVCVYIRVSQDRLNKANKEASSEMKPRECKFRDVRYARGWKRRKKNVKRDANEWTDARYKEEEMRKDAKWQSGICYEAERIEGGVDIYRIESESGFRFSVLSDDIQFLQRDISGPPRGVE